MFDRTLVILVAMTDHHQALDVYFCTSQRSHCEQSVIDRAQGGSRGNQNVKSDVPRQIEHQLRFIDGNENASGAFGDDGLRDIGRRANPREIDPDAAGFRRQMRRDGRIEAISLWNGLRLQNLRELHHRMTVSAVTSPGLNRLPVDGVEGGDKKRGEQSLSYVRIRAGDKQGLFHGRKACIGKWSCSRMEVRASTKRARRAAGSFAFSERRDRAVPGGTLGGRMG